VLGAHHRSFVDSYRQLSPKPGQTASQGLAVRSADLSKIPACHGVNEINDVNEAHQGTQSDKGHQNAQDNEPENLEKDFH
jgi:hypothetical protein